MLLTQTQFSIYLLTQKLRSATTINILFKKGENNQNLSMKQILQNCYLLGLCEQMQVSWPATGHGNQEDVLT